jgi:Flp pilus assembly protein TadG
MAPASRSAEPPRRAGLARCTAGAAAIEFGLTVGMVIALLFGTFHLGRALMVRNEISSALTETMRLVYIQPGSDAAAIEARLVERLPGYDSLDLEVEVTELADTSFMRVSVAFPYRIAIPFVPAREVVLRAETFAPRLSPTQG